MATPADRRLRLATAVRGDDGASLRDGLAEARRLGFDAVALNDRQAKLFDTSSATRELGAMLARHELAAGVLRVKAPDRGLARGADVDRLVDRVVGALEAARRLGFRAAACDLLVVPADRGAPSRAEPTPAPPAQAGSLFLPTADDVKRFTGRGSEPAPATEPAVDPQAAEDGLSAIAAKADATGMTLALSATLSDPRDLSALLGRVDCRQFARELDPAADVVGSGVSIDELVGLEPAVGHVRATDALGGAGRTRPAAIGEGDVPWGDVVEALVEFGYAGFVTLPAGSRASLPGL